MPLLPREEACRLSFFGSKALLHIPALLCSPCGGLKRAAWPCPMSLVFKKLLPASCWGADPADVCGQATSGTAGKGNTVLFWAQARAKSIGPSREEG